MRGCLRRRRALPAGAQHLDDLGQDRDGDLGRRHRADDEADRTVDAGESLVAEARFAQPLQRAAWVLRAAERADIEGVGASAPRSSAGSSSLGSWVRVTTAVRRSGCSRSSASSGHSCISSTPGKRPSVAKARRGSIDRHGVVRQRQPSAPAAGDMHGADDDAAAPAGCRPRRRPCRPPTSIVSLRPDASARCAAARLRHRQRAAPLGAVGVDQSSAAPTRGRSRAPPRGRLARALPRRRECLEPSFADPLDEDLDLAAAGEADFPGLLVGDAEIEQRAACRR